MAFILIVDDNSDNRYMLEVLLQRNGHKTTSAVNGREAIEKAHASPPDMIVSDILMPVMDGFTLCKEWKTDTHLKRIPFVFYTATYTEQKDVELGLSLGADMFLIKPMEAPALLETLTRILHNNGNGEGNPRERSLEEEMELLRQYNETLFRKLQKKVNDLETANATFREEMEKRLLTEANLIQSEKRLKMLLNSLPVGLAWADTEENVHHVNQKFTELFGYTAKDIPTMNDWFPLAFPDNTARKDFYSSWSAAIESVRQSGKSTPAFDVRVTCKNGDMRDISVIGTVISNLYLAVFTDITERKRLEEQLAQAQKLESIGNLAGGIAHDFNNILTAITGFAGLLQMKMDPADPLMSHVKELASAGMRGAALTHQLLAFSRKQILDMKPVNLNGTITDLEKMLRRLIREDIKLDFKVPDQPLMVMADANQVEQVVINLATNARDAMPGGGLLTIATGTACIDEYFVRRHGEGEAGQHAVVTIRDNGIGMNDDVKQKIFEPFFTTKETGKGTGLGLSVVYGIIKQHKGMIEVESEKNRGSVFTVYLPLLQNNINMEKEPSVRIEKSRGNETVLVAEDNKTLREMTKNILEDNGYRVIIAEDGETALEAFRAHKEQIKIAVLDLIMPGKRGFDTYHEIKKEADHIKVLFVTGYSEDEIELSEIKTKALPLLPKPFTPFELLRKIRQVLDGSN